MFTIPFRRRKVNSPHTLYPTTLYPFLYRFQGIPVVLTTLFEECKLKGAAAFGYINITRKRRDRKRIVKYRLKWRSKTGGREGADCFHTDREDATSSASSFFPSSFSLLFSRLYDEPSLDSRVRSVPTLAMNGSGL